MKKPAQLVFTLLLLAAAIGGCKKIISSIFPGVDIDTPAITFTLPPVPVVPPNELHLATFTQHFNLDSLIRVKTGDTFSSAAVTSIKVTQIKIAMAGADQQNNLANFESARFTFSSNANSDVAEIAAIHFPDEFADNYLYTAANAPELISYLKGNELVYNVYGKLRRITTKPLTMTVVVTLRAK